MPSSKRNQKLQKKKKKNVSTSGKRRLFNRQTNARFCSILCSLVSRDSKLIQSPFISLPFSWTIFFFIVDALFVSDGCIFLALKWWACARPRVNKEKQPIWVKYGFSFDVVDTLGMESTFKFYVVMFFYMIATW